MAKRYEAVVTVKLGGYETKDQAMDAASEWADDILATTVYGGFVNNADPGGVQVYDNETGEDIDE